MRIAWRLGTLEISTITNISEEVHHVFFMKWIEDMNSTKDRYIYMPRNDEEYKHVVGDYTARGLTGSIGSVDNVHIAWDRCPTMYKTCSKARRDFARLHMKSYTIVARSSSNQFR